MHSTTQMNVRIPTDILVWAKKSAKANRRSLTSFIITTLEEVKQKDQCDQNGGKNAN